MNLVFINLVKQNPIPFAEKVRCIAEKLGIAPNWLMAVFFLESSCNHRAQHVKSGATGLIQFMPTTARALGTTTAQLLQMSNVEQLDYVYQYLKPYAGRMLSFVDVYLAVFWPAAIGKPGNYTLETVKLSASLVASQNSGYDLDRNGTIQKHEIEEIITNRLGAAASFLMHVTTGSNEYILKLQRYLNTKGAALAVDGVFGPKTADAVQRVFGRSFLTKKEIECL